MTDVRVITGLPEDETPSYPIEPLRTIVQDAHLSFLVGAGTSSAFFELLGDIETALTELTDDDDATAIARASIQAHFFDNVIAPNVRLMAADPASEPVLQSYARFGTELNRLLLRRRSSLLNKKVNVFTTNVDMAIEVAFETGGLELNDGFAGKIRPTFDLGSFGSLRYRSGVRYEHRSEIPTFDLYKLHGSVGWRLNATPAGATDIEFDHRLETVAAVGEALEKVRSGLLTIESSAVRAADVLAAAAGMPLPAALPAFQEAYADLVIVNPEKTKFATTVLTETYYELIRRFANELERENTALFVHGFSFRDEHLRKLVLRAARTNPTLQVIVFCFTAEDRASYESLVRAIDLPNGNFTYITPARGGRLTLDAVVEQYLRPLADTPSKGADTTIDLVIHSADTTS